MRPPRPDSGPGKDSFHEDPPFISRLYGQAACTGAIIAQTQRIGKDENRFLEGNMKNRKPYEGKSMAAAALERFFHSRLYAPPLEPTGPGSPTGTGGNMTARTEAWPQAPGRTSTESGTISVPILICRPDGRRSAISGTFFEDGGALAEGWSLATPATGMKNGTLL